MLKLGIYLNIYVLAKRRIVVRSQVAVTDFFSFSKLPDRICGPLSLLFNGCWEDYYPVGKVAKA